ncbi:exported hypothetical protein [Cupriavidus taiwanensis]|nr:exported hypothetical protein [Cupriavidus taiwanensis]
MGARGLAMAWTSTCTSSTCARASWTEALPLLPGRPAQAGRFALDGGKQAICQGWREGGRHYTTRGARRRKT